MRNTVILLVILLNVLAASGANAGTTAYVNGRWWTGSTFTSASRYERDGVFVNKPNAPPNHTVDLGGAYVVPPYGDAHNHMPGMPPDVNRRALAAGVFYMMNPTILASSAPALRRALRGPGKVDAVLSMGAITAPGGHPEPLYVDILRKRIYPNMKPKDFLGDAFHYVTRRSDIGPALDRLVAQHAQFVKIMVLFSEEYAKRKDNPAYRGLRGLNPALVAPIVRAAHRRGLRVAAHIETAADFRVIVAARVDEAAHMPGYYVAKDDRISRFRITDADAKAAAASHIVVVPTASVSADNASIDAARLAEVQAMQRTNLEKLKAAGVPLLIGTDGQPDAAPKEAHYMEDLGVFTPREALTSLSETTPKWILPDRHIGKLAPGYEASFLALRSDPILNPTAIRDIVYRVKQGFAIPLPAVQPTLAITHVSVISMATEGVARDQTILIGGGRILSILSHEDVPAGVKVINGRNRYAIPGLWDMHVHVLAHGSEADAETMMDKLLAGGIVGVRDMGSTLDQLQRFRAAQWAGGGPWPDMVAAGPVVNGPPNPWSRPIEAHVANAGQAEPTVTALVGGGSQFIKAYSTLDAATYAAVAEATHKRGLVLAGHLPFAVNLQDALRLGQRSIEHMEVHLSKSCGRTPPPEASNRWVSSWAQGGLAARDRVEIALRADRDPRRCAAVLKAMAVRPVWWVPTLVLDFSDGSFIDSDFRRFAPAGGVHACQVAADEMVKTPAALRARALKGELDDVAQIHNAGVALLAGTDMPSPCSVPVASLRRELTLFVRAGLTPYQALRTATVEPARYFGRADAGTLAAGKVADIVLLNANPLKDIRALRTVSDVIHRGEEIQARIPH